MLDLLPYGHAGLGLLLTHAGALLHVWGGHLAMAVQTLPGVGGGGGVSMDSLTSGQFFKNIFNTITQAAYNHSDTLVDDGKLLLNALLMLMISWRGITLMLEQKGMGELLAEMIELIIYWGIAMMFLQQYKQITCEIVTGFSYIGDKLSAAGSSGHTYTCSNGFQPVQASDSRYNALFDGIKMMFTAIQNMWSTAQTEFTSGQFFLALVDAFIKLWISLLFIICAIMYFVVFASSQALIYIAIALGPIFIPLVVWPYARDYFSNWVRFLLIAGMYGVIGMLVIAFSDPVIQQVIGSTTSNGGVTDNPWGSMVANNLALLVAGLMICYFMLQVPGWANGIMSGRATFSPPSYRSWMNAARTAGRGASAGYRALAAGDRALSAKMKSFSGSFHTPGGRPPGAVAADYGAKWQSDPSGKFDIAGAHLNPNSLSVTTGTGAGGRSGRRTTTGGSGHGPTPHSAGQGVTWAQATGSAGYNAVNQSATGAYSGGSQTVTGGSGHGATPHTGGGATTTQTPASGGSASSSVTATGGNAATGSQTVTGGSGHGATPHTGGAPTPATGATTNSASPWSAATSSASVTATGGNGTTGSQTVTGGSGHGATPHTGGAGSAPTWTSATSAGGSSGTGHHSATPPVSASSVPGIHSVTGGSGHGPVGHPGGGAPTWSQAVGTGGGQWQRTQGGGSASAGRAVTAGAAGGGTRAIGMTYRRAAQRPGASMVDRRLARSKLGSAAARQAVKRQGGPMHVSARLRPAAPAGGRSYRLTAGTGRVNWSVPGVRHVSMPVKATPVTPVRGKTAPTRFSPASSTSSRSTMVSVGKLGGSYGGQYVYARPAASVKKGNRSNYSSQTTQWRPRPTPDNGGGNGGKK